MPFTTHAISRFHLVVITFYGAVTAREIYTAFQRVPHVEGWAAGFDTFWDCRQIASLDFEPIYLDPVAVVGKESSARLGPGRGAIVARRDLDRDIAQLLLAKMHDGVRERRLFPTVQAAADWLGLDSDAARSLS